MAAKAEGELETGGSKRTPFVHLSVLVREEKKEVLYNLNLSLSRFNSVFTYIIYN